MTWSQTSAQSTPPGLSAPDHARLGWVGEQAALRGVEKGVTGKRRQKTGVEEWLRTPRAPEKRS